MAYSSEPAVERRRCQADAADEDAWRICFDDMPAKSGNTVMLDLQHDFPLQEGAGVRCPRTV
ncbi:MAG: hypothetical protein ACI8RZ_003736 [Myxococcota bacterium]|jgi:hypothetical protein